MKLQAMNLRSALASGLLIISHTLAMSLNSTTELTGVPPVCYGIEMAAFPLLTKSSVTLSSKQVSERAYFSQLNLATTNVSTATGP